MQFKAGTVVRCIDNENAEQHLNLEKVYKVQSVGHRGHFVILEQINMPFASSRFELLRTNDNPSELQNASN